MLGNWKSKELYIIFIPIAALNETFDFTSPMEIIICALYVFHRNAEEKIVRGEMYIS